ncbi:heavy-metal-associated domain-containing protein [Alicyclobacillus sp. SO9]|uniref:heavy-metal-associated domain-containing protein n=1 Tax=Alicyclobacillus sp. SO9 TaxID=2665646 RepID=UPI0018E84EA1|nr:copper ion binding protein [Alicyclobacillus sp. SO9]QQE77176.1 heavy-metal-associated domain-containing protein [Alicyclobacillus sp. SO9]
MTTATITVKGMTCNGCVNSVTKALTSVTGVQDTVVSLDAENAKVTFEETQTSLQALKDAIEEAGYDVE